MSIIKRLLEKHGKDERKIKGDDRVVLDYLKSLKTTTEEPETPTTREYDEDSLLNYLESLPTPKKRRRNVNKP